MVKPVTKLDFLSDLENYIQNHNKLVADVFKPLNREQLNWQPGRKEWSIAQFFDHLNLTHEYYAPKTKTALTNPNTADPQRDLYKPSLWGRIYMYFAFNLKLSFPTAKEITPQSEFDHSVLDIYLKKQAQLSEILDHVDKIDLSRTPVPLEKGIKFNLGDCLKVLVYHDDLHIEQAKGIHAALPS
jgi:hypothetical protein